MKEAYERDDTYNTCFDHRIHRDRDMCNGHGMDIRKFAKLDSSKRKEVGDGQHGNDRFMTEREAKDFYTVIRLPEEIEDHSGEYPEGRIIHYDETTREAYIDTTNTHARIVAPTESGRVQNMSSRTYNTISWPGPA